MGELRLVCVYYGHYDVSNWGWSWILSSYWAGKWVVISESAETDTNLLESIKSAATLVSQI